MALPRQVIDTESVLGVDNGAIQSAIPVGIAPGANEIVYIDGVIGDGSFGDPFSGGDFDYYSIYIAPNTSITSAVYGAQWGTGIDARIDFFTAAGLPVSSNDDYGSVDPLNTAFRLTGGIYIIRVSHFANNQTDLFNPASGDGIKPATPLAYRLYIGINAGQNSNNISPALSNTFTGDSAPNIIDGGLLADIIDGGDGDDVLNGGYGNDTVTGGIGNDTFLWNIDGGTVQTDTYDLGTGGDEIVDVHSPLAANSITFLNNQFVVSGDDQLTLSGLSSSYTVNIYGGSGIDTIAATGITNSACRTNLYGGDGGDTLLGSGGASMTLFGGDGADTLITGSSTPIAGLGLVGGNGDDTYVITNASVFLSDRVGEGTGDRVKASVNFGLASASFVEIEFLETANDAGTAAIDLTGNFFAQTITGNAGMNKLDGGVDLAVDTLIGLGGNDTYVLGASTNDVVIDSAGIDKIESSITRSLAGFTAIEKLTLTGGSAINGTGNALANTIVGNGAANILNGGLGKDVLTGGLGNDAFVFNTALSATLNRDTITDFSASAVGNNDTIRLENAIFNKLVGVGTLSAAQFHNGAGVTTAHDADDRIIYNSTSGALFYDSDGTGAAAAIQFATLNSAVKPILTNADFFII